MFKQIKKEKTKTILTIDIFLLYLLIALITGFLSGFLTVKINHILIIVTGKLQTSGNVQGRYIVVGIASSILFFILYYFLTLNPDLIYGIIFSAIYAALYAIGVVIAQNRFKQSDKVLKMIISAMYTDSPNGNQITSDAFRISKQMLDSIPIANKEAILLLVFVFDSRFAVFFISLFLGRRFMIKRFINMNSDEQDQYLETWSTAVGLSLAVQALKSIVGFAYYTSNLSWSQIDYEGNVLKRSYLG